MGKLSVYGRVMRTIVVCGLLIGSLLESGAAAAPAASEPAPLDTAAQAGQTTPDPRMPGNHRAADAYYFGQRLGPGGTLSGLARATALKQAQALPDVRALPAAIGGKGQSIGASALAAPSAVWQQLGPAPEDTNTFNPAQDFRFGRSSGRATAIVVGPHTGVIYIGTGDGGVWKSTNDGASWTPLTDGQPSLAIGSLALDPGDRNDQILYAGTGETNYDFPSGFNGENYFGVGVLKTIDGGGTWTLLGSGMPNFGTYSATSIGIGAMAASGATVFAGTTKGLYRSTDGGGTWTQITVAAGFPAARVTEVIIDGANVYVVVSEADNGFTYAGVYKSTTGGGAGSFVPMMTGLPLATTWGRAQAAIARSAPQTLYLSIAQGANGPAPTDNLLGLFKTTDGGTTWAQTVAQPPNYLEGIFSTVNSGQGFYDQTIAVDPENASLVYGGGVNMVVSTDGGATWAKLLNVYCGNFTVTCSGPVHPDQHAVAFGSTSPAGTPRPLYLANDGGVFKTPNGNLGPTATWSNLNGNIATTQFYAGDVANDYTVTPVVAAGSQDNGTSRTSSPSPAVWNGILGGDGGFVAIDKTLPDTIYAGYPQGALKKTTNASAGLAITWTPIAPSCGNTLFVPPLAIDGAANHNHLVFGGGGFVCETINGGTSWGTSNASLFFGQFVQSVAIAPSASGTIYAGTNGGRIFRTTAANTGAAAVWSDIWTGKGLPVAPVTSIAVDQTDANIAYATFGTFGVAHVWRTINGGTTWASITGNLPDVPVTSIVTYASAPNPTLIVGTDVGIFLSTDNGTTWSALQAGLPKVGIDQVFTDGAHTTLFAATHGRGMWKIPIPADAPVPGPTITGIAPTGGPTTGGTGVTITGTNFSPGATVFFDGFAATNVVVNPTTITATTPAHQPGAVTVTVVNADNQGATLAQGFTYVRPAPQSIPSIRPTVPPAIVPTPIVGVPNPIPTHR